MHELVIDGVKSFKPLKIQVKGSGLPKDPIRVRVPDEYKPPKELVFRSDASLLTSAQVDIMIGVLEGNSNKEIAYIRNIAPSTVKNHITEIRLKLEQKGYTFPNVTAIPIKNRLIIALLQEGELELRDPTF